MSGGHFDYQQYNIGYIADQVQQLIFDNPSREFPYPDDVIEEFKTAVHHLRIAEIYSQRIDWLVSDDDGVDSFRERLKNELDEYHNE